MEYSKWSERLQGNKQKNGNSIFLPAAGYCGSSLYGAGSLGYYWLSSIATEYPEDAKEIFFGSGVYMGGAIRCNGFSVRPVCP